MLRITTLWLSESISPLSETDDVVHNVFLNTQCMIRACQLDVIRHFGANYCYNNIIIYIYIFYDNMLNNYQLLKEDRFSNVITYEEILLRMMP